MKDILKLELGRAFRNRLFFLSLLIGLCLAIANVVLIAAPYGLSETYAPWRAGIGGEEPPSLFGNWIGLTPFTITTSIFYYVLPLLACIPYGVSLNTDLSSRFASQLIVRAGRAHYFAAKATAVFLVSGTVLVIPLIVNIVAVAGLLPQIAPTPDSFFFAVKASSMLANLFYTNPWGYIAVFLILTFVGAGIYGLISTALAFFVGNPLAVLIAPFGLCVVLQLLLQGTPLEGFAPFNVLNPSQPAASIFWIVLLILTANLIGATAAMALKGRRFEELG